MKLSKVIFIKKILQVVVLTIITSLSVQAQEFSSLTKAVETGRSPGVKVKLLSTVGGVTHYALIFATGDEVLSGLTEFAQKYHVKGAHYTGFGDASSARLGWFDKDKKMFKVTTIADPSEVTGINGDISIYNGKPVAHVHLNLATSDGISHGGHLLELVVGPTLEIIVTVEPTALVKRTDPKYGALVIDPTLN